MKELIMIVRPEKLEDIKRVLDESGCKGMTVLTAMGCGAQKGYASEPGTVVEGRKLTINLLPKLQIEAVVPDELANDIVLRVCEACGSDHVGDGKIFVRTIDDAIRIRTGERGVGVL
ncbi:MAG: P-II family nitrogen regulator [Lachnospiraceae bacterium]